MNYQIFISYRWSESGELPGRIYERLTYKDGYYVFYDEQSSIHKIEEIKRSLSESKVMILICGLGTFDRCYDENDIVRCELKQAIEEKKHIIVVQTSDFKMPKQLPDDIQEVLEFIRLRHRHGEFDSLYNKIVKSIPIQPYGKNTLDFHNDNINKCISSGLTDLNYLKDTLKLLGSTLSFKTNMSDWQKLEEKANKTGTLIMPALAIVVLSVNSYYDYFSYMTIKNHNTRNDGNELVYDIQNHKDDNHSIEVSIFSRQDYKINNILKKLVPQQLFVYSNNRLLFVVLSNSEYSLFNKMI